MGEIYLDDDPIAHAMPLLAAPGRAPNSPILPSAIEAILKAESDLDAVSVEYVVSNRNRLVDATHPILFWQCEAGKARQRALVDLNLAAQSAFSAAVGFQGLPEQSGLTPRLLYSRTAPQCLLGMHQRILAVYTRDVTFFLPAHIGDQLESIDGASFETEADLSRLMAKVVGEAWYLRASSNHELLSQRARTAAVARVFDAIFEQQTGQLLLTSLDPSLPANPMD